MHGVLLTDTPAATTPSQWAVIVGGILFLIYVTCIRPMRNKAKRDPLARKPGEAMLAQQRAVERDMTALLVEYEQMIRRMTAQVETRITKLELLMGEADRKLAALKAAASAAIAAGDGLARSIEPAAPDPSWPLGRRRDGKPTFAPLSLERDAAAESAAGALVRAVSGATPTGRSAAPASMLPPTDDPPEESADLKPAPAEVSPATAAAAPASPHAELYELADEGLSAGQIARRLGRPHGEVDLILALRPRLAASPPAATRGGATSTSTSRSDQFDPPDIDDAKGPRDPLVEDDATAEEPVAEAARAGLAELVGAASDRGGNYSAHGADAKGTTDAAAAENPADPVLRSLAGGTGAAPTPARRDGGSGSGGHRDGGHRKHRKHNR